MSGATSIWPLAMRRVASLNRRSLASLSSVSATVMSPSTRHSDGRCGTKRLAAIGMPVAARTRMLSPLSGNHEELGYLRVRHSVDLRRGEGETLGRGHSPDLGRAERLDFSDTHGANASGGKSADLGGRQSADFGGGETANLGGGQAGNLRRGQPAELCSAQRPEACSAESSDLGGGQ